MFCETFPAIFNWFNLNKRKLCCVGAICFLPQGNLNPTNIPHKNETKRQRNVHSTEHEALRVRLAAEHGANYSNQRSRFPYYFKTGSSSRQIVFYYVKQQPAHQFFGVAITPPGPNVAAGLEQF